MVARLVAVGVLADLPGNVGLGAAAGLLRGAEERIDAGQERLLAAVRLHQPDQVVRHKKAVLPAVGFGVVVVDLGRVERGHEAPVEPRTHKTGLRVEHVAPVLRRAHIFLILLIPAEHLRHLRHAPVVVGVFQGLGHRLVFVVGKHQPVAAEAVQPELPVARGGQHSLESLLQIEASYTPRCRVGDYRGRVISYHTIGFVAPELPNRELSGLAVNRDEGIDEVGGALRLQLAEQGMQAPERVPEGEDCIMLVRGTVAAKGPVHLSVHAAVFPVRVGVQGRVDGAVVQGRIEDLRRREACRWCEFGKE